MHETNLPNMHETNLPRQNSQTKTRNEKTQFKQKKQVFVPNFKTQTVRVRQSHKVGTDFHTKSLSRTQLALGIAVKFFFFQDNHVKFHLSK